MAWRRGKGGGRRHVHQAVLLLAAMAAGSLATSPASAQSVGSGIAIPSTGTAISNDGCAEGATATNAYAIAIQCGAFAGQSKANFAHPDASPSDVYSNIAIGVNAQAPSVNGSNIAIGGSAIATSSLGGDQLAIGNRARAINADAVAIGTQTEAAGVRSIVIGGNWSKVDEQSDDTILIGVSSTALAAPRSLVLGTKAHVSAANAVVLGHEAMASQANSVALGAGSKANTAAVATSGATIHGTQHLYAGGAPSGIVSVGSADATRQITNVAAGQVSATSTDAVNGSQLYAAHQAIDKMGEDIFNLDNRVTNLDDNHGGAAYGDYAQAFEAEQGTAMGHSARVTSDRGVALGAGSVATRQGMNGQAEAVSGVAVSSTQGAVSVGSEGNERQITNVAGGTQATDAVNLRQLQAVQSRGVQYDTNEDGTVNHNQVTLGGDTTGGGTRIRNVAPGVAPTDAVNVGQLHSAEQGLHARIDDVARTAYAGVAAAMAVQMPASYVPGRTVVRVGTAVFKGESAMGVSFRRTSDNNAWSLTGGVGVSRAGTAATVGVEWVF